MVNTENLETRAKDALNWAGNHWGPGRMVLSFLVLIPFGIMTLGMFSGAQQAYAVDSAATIVPTDMWMELANVGDEATNPIEGALLVGVMGVFLSCVDAAGRITFAYLLWVPEPAWNVASYLVFLPPVVLTILNLAWAFQKAYRMRDPSLQAPEGGIDG